MASQAPLDFDNYRAYEGQANPTTQAQLQTYMANQNDLLTEILQTLVWLPSRVYALNNVVYCGGGFWAKCTTAGTSGATEPQWSTGTISDGGCVWSVSEGGSALGTHIANTNNPHSVTKAQVGLGNVVNSGDSATPTQGGTDKFTTGGAYTALAGKVDISQGSEHAGKALVVDSSGNVAVTALKTINNNSIVGEGNIQGGHTWTTTPASGGIGGASSTTPAVVVENYRNGTSWYRVWSDGWIEQGGRTANTGFSSTPTTISLVKSFSSADYMVTMTGYAPTARIGDDWDFGQIIRTQTAANFSLCNRQAGQLNWYACGY